MFKYFFVSVPLVVELFLYSSDLDIFGLGKSLFNGVPKATPQFRDLYILILNYQCHIPIHQFKILGSCSDSFYGVIRGEFDYPTAAFYIYNLIPGWLVKHPNLSGFLLGTFFLMSCLVTATKIEKNLRISNLCCLIAYSLLIYSFPFRYVIERGQLDQIAWILALLAFPLFLSKTYQRRSNKNILSAGLLIFLSVLIKGFTLPYLFIYSVLVNSILVSNRYLKVFLYALIPISLLLLTISGTAPGSFASNLHVDPGIVFGFQVPNAHNSLNLLNYLKIVIATIGFLTFASVANKILKQAIRHYKGDSLTPIMTAALGASSFIIMYFFTSSANYKLVSLGLLFLSLAGLMSARSETQNIRYTKSNMLSILTFGASSLYILFYNYRPYFPELQFLAVDYCDYISMPFSVGCAIAYLAASAQAIIGDNSPSDYLADP
ncbi:hypothetical protein [Synechococcus sp. LTW-R]|uniref:hypothetical protein n=1 Tax=Synechococcus sp. LTW-R TaxID=2751170 RepID=UPI001627BB5F|nr:hypothetical protein [Synechococcus sp. LTW-R]QNG28912.1 hypothetical protein H0O22_09170 [Synechococcus sp. LTW-R]